MIVDIKALSRTAAQIRIVRTGIPGPAAILSLYARPTARAGTVIGARRVTIPITMHHRCDGPGFRMRVGRRPHDDGRDGDRVDFGYPHKPRTLFCRPGQCWQRYALASHAERVHRPTVQPANHFERLDALVDGHRQRDVHDLDEMPHGQRRGTVDPDTGPGSGDRHSAASGCLYRYGQTSLSMSELSMSDRWPAALRPNSIVSRSQWDPAPQWTVQVRVASLQRNTKRSVMR